jgi:glycyl-tRNA synthetase alpha subunit
VFNTLDASGSIGVTERANYIFRVRQLAIAIANAWTGADAGADLTVRAQEGAL